MDRPPCGGDLASAVAGEDYVRVERREQGAEVPPAPARRNAVTVASCSAEPTLTRGALRADVCAHRRLLPDVTGHHHGQIPAGCAPRSFQARLQTPYRVRRTPVPTYLPSDHQAPCLHRQCLSRSLRFARAAGRRHITALTEPRVPADLWPGRDSGRHADGFSVGCVRR
jgi:hypothetical protein